MMNELVKLVSQKTGISESQANQAVSIVLNWLKERLPAPIAAQIDGLVGQTGASNPLGGLFGK